MVRRATLAALTLVSTSSCDFARDDRDDRLATRGPRRDTVVIDGTHPSCTGCRIDVLPPVRLGTTEDEHIPQRVPAILRDSRGMHYLTFHGWGNKPILRYDSTGRYVGRLGRYGQGPGEYTMTFGTIIGVGDSVVIALGGPRAQVFGPGGEFARTAQVRGSRVFALAPNGSGATYSVTDDFWRDSLLEPHVVRISADGAPPDSFPVFTYVSGFRMDAGADSDKRWHPLKSSVQAALAPDGSVWTWAQGNFRLERYAPDGRSLQVIGVTAPGVRPLVMTRAQSDSIAAKVPTDMPPARRPVNAPRRPYLKDLKTTASVDSAGLLWIVRAIPAPSYDTITFKGLFLSPDEAPGEMTIPREAEDRLYHTIIEVIDPAVPALIARTELPFLGHAAATGYIGRVTQDDEGHYVSSVYPLVLRRR